MIECHTYQHICHTFYECDTYRDICMTFKDLSIKNVKNDLCHFLVTR